MSKSRPPSFQFYPRDLIADPAVRMMTPEARGAYLMLLCQAWLADEPGTLPDDDEMLARLSESFDRWGVLRPMVVRAFRVEAERWVQRRMVEERAAQVERRTAAENGAALTNEKRWGWVAGRPDSESHSDRSTVTPAFASASATAVEAKNPSPPRRARREREPEGFVQFYQTYPRRDGRRAAAQAFKRALGRLPEYRSEDLVSAAGLYRGACEREGREVQFIPLPTTWLNQDRFREFFDESEAPDPPGSDAPGGNGAG